jgi:type III pantothenate kinase
MLLCVDIGNTNIVIALFNGEEVSHVWRICTDTRRTGDEYGAMIYSMFRNDSVPISAIKRAALSSVVPLLISPFTGMIERMTGKKPLIIDAGLFPLLPVRISESAIHEIGNDMMCNAVEAYSRFGAACIIADFGTALTFTAIGNAGDIRGAAIAPGIYTAVKSLSGSTAQLPEVPLVAPPSSLGMNTTHSIQAGVILGYKGLVEYLIATITSDLAALEGIQPEDIQVIATGGLNSVLSPVTKVFKHIDKNLTLCGLKRIADIVSPPPIHAIVVG